MTQTPVANARGFVYAGGMQYTPGSVEHIHHILTSALDATAFGTSDRAAWREDPAAWSRERASTHLWSKQKEIMESVRDNKRTAVHSCHEVGKTFTAAQAVGWWLDVHAPGTAFVVSTAPTAAQVKALLWREIGRLHARAGLPGRTNLTEWYINDELVGFGRKPSDHNESAFQGIHAPHVLVVLDEAGGVPTPLWIAAEANTANRGSRILAIGNPDSLNTDFHVACQPGSGWNVIHVGYQHTPAFTGESVPASILDQLISEEWVSDMRDKWGEDSALFSAKVKGEFPAEDSEPWKVIPYHQLMKCKYLSMVDEPGVAREAGIDIGAGSDRTVIAERVGMRLGRVESFQSSDPLETIDRLAATLAEWGTTRVKVDSIGVGWAVCGALRERSARHMPKGSRIHNAEVIPVNVGDKAANSNRFMNKRAEIWFTIGRELTRTGAWGLETIPDAALEELNTPKYEIQGAKIKVEAKKEIIKRIGRSTDYADAILLAFYMHNRAATTTGVGAFTRGLPGSRTRSPFTQTGGQGRGSNIFGR